MKTGAGFGRQFIVTDDSHIWKTTMEILHVLLKRLFLPGGTGVRRRFTILCTPTGIDDMAAHGIVTGHAVGHFPRVHIRVLVIVHQAFHSAVQMEQVGISDLLPAAAVDEEEGGE